MNVYLSKSREALEAARPLRAAEHDGSAARQPVRRAGVQTAVLDAEAFVQACENILRESPP